MKSSDGATVINVPAEKGTTSTSTSDSKAKVIGSTPKAVIATTTATKHGQRWKKGFALLDFLLRLFGIATALAATVTMGTTDQTLPFFTQFFQFHANYSDLPAFTFFVVANAIVTGYLVLSLPFSIITIIRSHIVGARILLLICDTVMVALSSAGAAAAAAIVYLAHTGNDKANWVAICEQFDEFCQQTSGAVVASFVTAAILMLLVIMAAFALRKH